MTNNRRIALALNNLATVLQQLAVELTEDQAEEVVHPLHLTTAQLREALAAQVPVVTGATKAMLAEPVGLQREYGIPEPPASVAEPECGCSLYARCDYHEGNRPRGCKCNSPMWRSSECGHTDHADIARSRPDRDPALLD